MSQQHGPFIPPPTPSYLVRRQLVEQSGSLQSDINRSYGSPQDMTAPRSNSSTPLSPMFSPISISTTSSPAMTTRTYNPQQWSQTSAGGGSHVVFSPTQRSGRDMTGMESMMPSPPPPYTPPPESIAHTMRPSPLIGGNGFVSSPLSAETSIAGQGALRSTPPRGPPTQFPPPPGADTRDRSASSSQRSRFSITGIAARVKRSESSEQMSSLAASHATTSPPPSDLALRAPSSRRAASTGAIMTTHSTICGRSSPEGSSWEPGMPLPPPPPGPPPPGHRSQSLNRYPPRHTNASDPQLARSSQNSVHQPSRRRHEDTLGAIPPTPSDWRPDDDDQNSAYQELRIDTSQPLLRDTRTSRAVSQTSIQDAGAESIRARRSRSRANRDTRESVPEPRLAVQSANNSPGIAQPTDLVLDPAEGLLRRRRAAAAEASSTRSSPGLPPSPDQYRRQAQGRNPPMLTPPYTPSGTVPRHKDALLSVAAKNLSESFESNDRPLSHILHAPIDETNISKPLSPQKSKTEATSTSANLPAFMQSSLDRYIQFVRQEASAQSDRQRLELFASFMVYESRLRRNQYPEAFSTMAGEIMELTRDLWRPLSREQTPNQYKTTYRESNSDSVESQFELESSFQTSVCSSAELTPATDTESLADESECSSVKKPGNPWGDKFKPCLSPIPSMAVSTVPDEEDSRGRAASRWWESSADGSVANGGRKLERTRQETKYMSLHPQDLIIQIEPSPNQSTPTPETSKRAFQYGPNEYPPEKIGWEEEAPERSSPSFQAMALLSPRGKAPVGRFPEKPALDVSRLVTLPPPYPRHHPAVNNSHPALSALRASHRVVADLSNIREVIQSHEVLETNRRQAWRTSAGERLRRFRTETQEAINARRILYTDAPQMELEFRKSETTKVLAQAEAQSHEYRQKVAEPVRKMLVEQLQSCDGNISQLIEALDAEARLDQSMLAQTEGDERPELVEQLTLLKWLFESREHIFKEYFDVETALVARDNATVLTRYHQSRDEEQVRLLEKQLDVEGQERQLRYGKDVKSRFDRFREIVERHVSRGVEIQLSAFWDIAPGLVEVVQRIPQDLRGFEILVPSRELAENVSYHDFPMQYLFTILIHAKKSAYQFVEAQTNLLCLLHEVHTATESASRRLLEIERTMAGEKASDVQASMARAKTEREQELTEDLKEKVGEVESQWREAMGLNIEKCTYRVKMLLQESGGWDQSLESLEV